MADLIEKFFQEELSKPEYEELAKRLSTSGEEADRFADKAEFLYFQYGLPDPHPAGKLARFFKSAWGKLFPVIVVGGSLALWYWWPKTENEVVAQKIPIPQEVVKFAASPRPTPARVYTPAVNKVSKTTPMTPVPATLTPPPGSNLEMNYRRLNVVVDQESDGIITVRIIGPDGLEARKLYEGPLEIGQWAFTWDGILDSGQPASPGTYRVEANGGAGMKSKEVIIREK